MAGIDLPDLGGPAYAADPYPVLHRLRIASPVFWSPRYRRWVLTRYDDVLTVLRDTTRFSSAVVPQIPPSERVPALVSFVELSARWLFFLDAPEHGPERALVARHLSPSALTDGEDETRRAAHGLLDKVSGVPFDLVADYAHPLAVHTIAGLLCTTDAEHAAFRGWCSEIEAASLAARDPLARQRGFQAITAVTEYLQDSVAQRDNRPLPPLLQRIKAAAPDTTAAQMAAHGLVLVFAGVETTQNLIGNAVHALLQNPAQWALLKSAPSLAEAAVNETLRYDAPVLGVVRRAIQTIVLHGVSIQAGDECAVLIGAANRDPAQFAAPDVFDIQRAASGHLAFGYGPHYCTGAALARRTACVALEVLSERRPGLRREGTPATWRDHDPIVRGLKQLQVTGR